MWKNTRNGLSLSLSAIQSQQCHVKSKVKLSHERHAGAKEERKCRSYSFLTSALDWGQRHALPRFTPWKGPQVPIV
jgi:hypothetical protein